jgi:integrase
VLSDDEIRQLWSWEYHHSALLRFLLLTGLRISEAQKGKRDGDRWIVPAEHSKNGKEHWVHLTDLALKQLETPFERSATAVQAWLRRRLDSLNVQPRWIPHDLRRTTITRLNGVGVDPIVVERYVNHTLPKLMATYNKFEYEDERIAAAKSLTVHIEELIDV